MKFFNKYNFESRNIFLIYLNTLFAGMLFFIPIVALYFEKHLFTVTNVALIYSIKAIAVVIFEYPTGAIADLLGRKKSIVLANISVLIGVIFLYLGTNMTMFIIYALLVAFGHSLFSGADSALIFDTLKQENKEKYFKKIIGTKYALWPIGAMIGSIVGGHLALVSLSFPILITLIPLSLALIMTLLLEEPEYEKENHKNIFKHMFKSSKIILRNSQLVILLISALIFIGIGDSIHYLKPIFFEFHKIPIIYFGYIFAASFALSSLGHYISHEVSEKIGNKTTLIFGAFFLILFIILATFVDPWLAISFLLIKQLFYGVGRPATEHLMHLETDSKTRATVISGYNLMRHLGVAIFIMFIGYFAELYNINIGFRIGAIAMASILILFLFLKEK
jgi:MFS family permease